MATKSVEPGHPALSGMFTRAEVTYAWPRDAYLGHLTARAPQNAFSAATSSAVG